MKKKKVTLILGTRPEAIKMAPVYRALKAKPNVEVNIVSTGQHRELLRGALELFKLPVSHDLGLMKPGQTVSGLAAEILLGLQNVFASERPDLVLVHGDTVSGFASSLHCFYERIPVAHVEAGLRSYRLDSPFPEEFHRQQIARTASFHFAPTKAAAKALRLEGIDRHRIAVTGSTGIDAMLEVLKSSDIKPSSERSTVLVTTHRRENLGVRLREILGAIRDLATERKDLNFVYPMHPNPKVKGDVEAELAGLSNVSLDLPMRYDVFVRALARSRLVLTDSGGVQEEAASLGKSTLLLRDTTERSDGIGAGNIRIVGSNRQAILSHSKELLAMPHLDLGLPQSHFASAKIAEMISTGVVA